MSFRVLDDFFRFSKKIEFLGILGPLGNHVSRWIRDLWSKGKSLILAYFYIFLIFWVLDDFFRFSKNRVLGYSWSTLLWHRCYYPNWSRDALSPVCGIFLANSLDKIKFVMYLSFLESDEFSKYYKLNIPPTNRRVSFITLPSLLYILCCRILRGPQRPAVSPGVNTGHHFTALQPTEYKLLGFIEVFHILVHLTALLNILPLAICLR